MEKSEYRKNACDMIYLVSCAIKGEIPDKARVDEMDLTALFEVCQKHILTACAAYALAAAGVSDDRFTQAKEKAIRKNVLLDAERRKILARFEQEHIWYMPLKGAILKDWYPKLGMRQMSDNDILCDNTKMDAVRSIFTDLGYACEEFGKDIHDVYYKKPVLNFEMHRELFSRTNRKICDYYSDVKSRLISDEDGKYGHHFSIEDFYLYILAHEYKHFCVGGTGVRSLVDTYIFLQRHGDALDRDYVAAELEKLGIADFEKDNRELSMKLFSGEELTDEEKKILDYHIFSGTYGNMSNKYNNAVQRYGNGSKKKYILYRIFPPMEHYKTWFPWAYKHKILIPAAWLYRPVRAIFKRRKKLATEFEYLKRNT